MRGPWLGLVVAAWAAPQCPAGGGCKLELGTWAERLGELVEGIAAAGTLDAARGQAAEVLRWLDLQASFVQESSSPLGPAAASVTDDSWRDPLVSAPKMVSGEREYQQRKKPSKSVRKRQR